MQDVPQVASRHSSTTSALAEQHSGFHCNTQCSPYQCTGIRSCHTYLPIYITSRSSYPNGSFKPLCRSPKDTCCTADYHENPKAAGMIGTRTLSAFKVSILLFYYKGPDMILKHQNKHSAVANGHVI